MGSQNSTRNILQTHQERTVIKQAPDVVVYIDGLPYLFNRWGDEGPTVVNFNDYVVSASGAADIGTPIPSATINLSVPNHEKSKFMGPGGNVPLYTMSEIKVFTKGYYLTKDGQTVYHRIFWGIVDSITQADNGTSLEITLSCKGILRLFDIMQFNMNPALMTGQQAGTQVTPFKDVQALLTPLAAIEQMFSAPLGNEFGNIDTVDPGTILPVTASGVGGDEANAKAIIDSVYSSSVSKWFLHLKSIRKAVRLFGIKGDLSDRPAPLAASDKDATVRQSEKGATEKNTKTLAEALSTYEPDLIMEYLPSFAMGELNLMQSNVVSRLQRVSEMVSVMGWEGYQDLDGGIVIKPPLFNLNPLNTSTSEDRNPFIINLDEKLGTDTLLEDESQVVLTRVAVQGTLQAANAIQIENGGVNFLPVGIYADPMLIRQFGLRHEGVKQISFVGNSANALYAYAVSELTKTIKRWKTYTVTIPMRPELRLGFPIHIAWRDMMGYLENISWTYTRGNSATMTLSTTMVRTREVVGVQKNGTMTYAPVENAILRWTKARDSKSATGGIVDTNVTVATPVAARLTALQTKFQASTATTTNTVGMPQDLPGCAWRIQNDTGLKHDGEAPGATDVQFVKAGTSPDKFKARFESDFFVKQRPADAYYMLAVQTYAMPYTDSMGYVLARPFPWGRYTKLETALDVFTRASGGRTGSVLSFDSTRRSKADPNGLITSFQKDRTDAFLLTGLGTPSFGSAVAQQSQLITKLTSLVTLMSDNVTHFVVTYPTKSDPNGSGLFANPYNASTGDEALRSTANPGAGGQEAWPRMSVERAQSYSEDMVRPPELPEPPSERQVSP